MRSIAATNPSVARNNAKRITKNITSTAMPSESLAEKEAINPHVMKV
jgi:hypothetical protein